jgi:flavin reductase (DIM6/NTAB) family NADH-FMN oxidoreductase RutF
VTTESDADPFQEFVATLDYSMFVVTTRASGAPAGCLMGFATQASINPPRFIAALSKRNNTFRAARQATHLAVHLIPRTHLALAQMFGALSGDRVDKFQRCAWHDGPEHMPILDDAASWFVAKIHDRFDFGDHVGHLLAPVSVNPATQQHRWVCLADVFDLTPGQQP